MRSMQLPVTMPATPSTTSTCAQPCQTGGGQVWERVGAAWALWPSAGTPSALAAPHTREPLRGETCGPTAGWPGEQQPTALWEAPPGPFAALCAATALSTLLMRRISQCGGQAGSGTARLGMRCHVAEVQQDGQGVGAQPVDAAGRLGEGQLADCARRGPLEQGLVHVLARLLTPVLLLHVHSPRAWSAARGPGAQAPSGAVVSPPPPARPARARGCRLSRPSTLAAPQQTAPAWENCVLLWYVLLLASRAATISSPLLPEPFSSAMSSALSCWAAEPSAVSRRLLPDTSEAGSQSSRSCSIALHSTLPCVGSPLGGAAASAAHASSRETAAAAASMGGGTACTAQGHQLLRWWRLEPGVA